MTASSGVLLEMEMAMDGSAEVRGQCEQGDGDISALRRVMQFLRKKFTVKTAANIAVRAKCGVRTVEFWLSPDPDKRRDMGVGAFIKLVQSDVGLEVITEVMAELPPRDRPRWWVRHCNMARLISIEAAQKKQDDEIKQLRLDMSGPEGR